MPLKLLPYLPASYLITIASPRRQAEHLHNTTHTEHRPFAQLIAKLVIFSLHTASTTRYLFVQMTSANEILFSQGFRKSQSINPSVTREIASLLDENSDSIVSKATINIFKHGRSWNQLTHSDEGPTQTKGHMAKQTSQISIKHDDIKNCNLVSLFSNIANLRQQHKNAMESQFFATLFEATSNREPINMGFTEDPRQAIREMWNSIKLSLNEDMSLSEPCMAATPEIMKQLLKQQKWIDENTPEFHSEMKEIRRRKHIETLVDHFQNLKKFKLHEDDVTAIDNSLSELREASESPLHQE